MNCKERKPDCLPYSSKMHERCMVLFIFRKKISACSSILSSQGITVSSLQLGAQGISLLPQNYSTCPVHGWSSTSSGERSQMQSHSSSGGSLWCRIKYRRWTCVLARLSIISNVIDVQTTAHEVRWTSRFEWGHRFGPTSSSTTAPTKSMEMNGVITVLQGKHSGKKAARKVPSYPLPFVPSTSTIFPETGT